MTPTHTELAELRPPDATHMRRPEYLAAWLFDRQSTMPVWLIAKYQSRPLPNEKIGHYATAVDGEFWRWLDPAKFEELYTPVARTEAGREGLDESPSVEDLLLEAARFAERELGKKNWARSARDAIHRRFVSARSPSGADDPADVWDDYCEETPVGSRSPQGALAFGFHAAFAAGPQGQEPGADELLDIEEGFDAGEWNNLPADAPAGALREADIGLTKAMEIIGHMRQSKAYAFEDKYSGQRGRDRADALYDAYVAIRAALSARQG